MFVSFEKILDDVLTIAGESPELSPVLEPWEESPVLSVEHIISRALAVEAAIATLHTDPLLLDEIGEFPQSLLWRGPEAILRCPEDYLKFMALRMPDWPQRVTVLTPADSLRGRLGIYAPARMRSPERPVVREGRDRDGLYLSILGSSARGDVPAEALYIPRPRVWPDGGLTISAAAYPELVKALKSRVES